MSVLTQILSYGRDVVLLTERVYRLLEDRKTLLATLARVALGVAALAGVPVALAISHQARPVVRRRFA